MFGVACADNQSMSAKPLKLEKKNKKRQNHPGKDVKTFS